MPKGKPSHPPMCRMCRQYDRFRNRCKVETGILILNGIPNGPCPEGRVDEHSQRKSKEEKSDGV